MIKKISTFFAFVALTIFCVVPFVARAADGVTLTITPPLFELNLNPGDSWSSSIKVVNTNAGAIAVDNSVVGFSAADDEGHGQFTDLSALAGDSDALANWIATPRAPVVIPSNGAGEVPFTISVPDDASPGGHYAAILIGTGGGADATGTEGSHVGVSSFISALIFVRVAGTITEAGNIASFTSDRSYYEDPDVALSLEFANTGNVHLRPVGEIDIYNAWGKERGTIPINQTPGFGYVLPSSTRKFDVEWKGAPSFFDIGPYTAVATFAYGDEGNKSVSQTISFWILPIKKLLTVMFGTLFFIAVFFIAIRRYVKKALALEMAKYGSAPPAPHLARTLREPVAQGVIDLRNAYAAAETKTGFDWPRYFKSLKRYAIAGILILLVILGIIWISLYIKELAGSGGGFKVNIQADQANPASF